MGPSLLERQHRVDRLQAPVRVRQQGASRHHVHGRHHRVHVGHHQRRQGRRRQPHDEPLWHNPRPARWCSWLQGQWGRVRVPPLCAHRRCLTSSVLGDGRVRVERVWRRRLARGQPVRAATGRERRRRGRLRLEAERHQDRRVVWRCARARPLQRRQPRRGAQRTRLQGHQSHRARCRQPRLLIWRPPGDAAGVLHGHADGRVLRLGHVDDRRGVNHQQRCQHQRGHQARGHLPSQCAVHHRV
mmetsp:Transcript_39809/g.118534  ORF Transcript_39809/g.118534 Transcript_39809/m.118534 type:complete len:243 (-) Transcript_39809:1156-1884(-)